MAAAGHGTADGWIVNISDEADAGLRRLRGSRRTRKVWQEAIAIAEALEVHPNPLTLGDACHPPLDGVRRIHFWNDKYRLAWYVIEDQRRVDVLAVGPKDSSFYSRVALQLRLVTDQLAEDAIHAIERQRRKRGRRSR